MEKNVEDPQKIKNRPTISSSNSTSGNIPRGNKNINLKIYLYPHVLCSIIYNSQVVEATSVPINGWMDKETEYIIGDPVIYKELCQLTLSGDLYESSTSSATLHIISHFNCHHSFRCVAVCYYDFNLYNTIKMRLGTFLHVHWPFNIFFKTWTHSSLLPIFFIVFFLLIPRNFLIF